MLHIKFIFRKELANIMITLRISELRLGEYPVIMKAEVQEEVYWQAVSSIMINRGYEIANGHFRVESPKLHFIVKELEEKLKIKFVKEKPPKS